MEEKRIEVPLSSGAATGYRRLSWGALFAGLIVAMMTQILMSLLGMAVGAQTLNATGEADAGLGIGAGIWLGISMLLSLFLGGWAAARLAGIPRRTESVLHGVLTWGLSTVSVFVLVGTVAGGLFKGAASLMGGAAQTATQAAAEAADNPSATNDATSAAQSAAANVRQEIQARGGVDNIVDQAAERGREAAQQAAGPVAGGSLAGFLIMLLSGVAAGLGGLAGTPKNLVLTRLPAFERRRSMQPVV